MKNEKESRKTANFERKEEYRQQIIEMVEQIDDISVLKKIYTVTKTHITILNEKEGS